MRKRPFPVFVRCIFEAATFCSLFIDSDGSKLPPIYENKRLLGTTAPSSPGTPSPDELDKQMETQKLKEKMKLKLKIPDVVFSGLIRFVESDKWEECGADPTTGTTVWKHSPIKEIPIPCQKSSATISLPPNKILDVIMSVEERCWWDDSYGVGRVEEVVGEPCADILRVDLCPALLGGNRDMLVLRTARKMKDGTCVYLWKSLQHSSYPVREGYIRADCKMAGFVIKPLSDNAAASIVTSISILDPKGDASEETIRRLNIAQACLPVSLKKRISTLDAMSGKLIQKKFIFPFMLPARFNCNSSWNPWSDKEETPPRLKFKEGQNIILLEQNDSKDWIGFCDNTKGVVDIDYLRSSPDLIAEYVAEDNKDKVLIKKSTNTNYLPFIELLSRPNLMLITALCTCTEHSVAERAAHAFLFCMKIFPGRTIPLLVNIIAVEVRNTGIIQGSTLFRGNDIASHLLSAYCQLVGRKYLVKTVKPFVEKIISFYAQGKSFEVDPARAPAGMNISENAQNLAEYCTSFLHAVAVSLKNCPRSFRVICYFMQREVHKKFPDGHNIVLSGFFFLRFISPAIVSPEFYGLIDGEVSKEARRGLVLVSKVIQNLANGVEFGEKEEHMIKLNPFIRNNKDTVESFFQELSRSTEDVGTEEGLELEDVDICAKFLHAVICENLSRIADKLASIERFHKQGSRDSSNTFRRLLEVLIECGLPPPMPPDYDLRKATQRNKRFKQSMKKQKPKLGKEEKERHNAFEKELKAREKEKRLKEKEEKKTEKVKKEREEKERREREEKEKSRSRDREKEKERERERDKEKEKEREREKEREKIKDKEKEKEADKEKQNEAAKDKEETKQRETPGKDTEKRASSFDQERSGAKDKPREKEPARATAAPFSPSSSPQGGKRHGSSSSVSSTSSSSKSKTSSFESGTESDDTDSDGSFTMRHKRRKKAGSLIHREPENRIERMPSVDKVEATANGMGAKEKVLQAEQKQRISWGSPEQPDSEDENETRDWGSDDEDLRRSRHVKASSIHEKRSADDSDRNATAKTAGWPKGSKESSLTPYPRRKTDSSLRPLVVKSKRPQVPLLPLGQSETASRLEELEVEKQQLMDAILQLFEKAKVPAGIQQPAQVPGGSSTPLYSAMDSPSSSADSRAAVRKLLSSLEGKVVELERARLQQEEEALKAPRGN